MATQDDIRDYLRDNLSVQVSTETEIDFGNAYTIIKVTISLAGEVISESSDSIRQP